MSGVFFHRATSAMNLVLSVRTNEVSVEHSEIVMLPWLCSQTKNYVLAWKLYIYIYIYIYMSHTSTHMRAHRHTWILLEKCTNA